MSTVIRSALPPLPFEDFPVGEAVFSDDPCPAGPPGGGHAGCARCRGAGRVHDYRYCLDRRWAYAGPVMCWVGLNPSAADHEHDDATIRRMCGFARREGCRGICVLNAFALISTDPAALRTHPDPVGPGNDAMLAGIRDSTDGPVVIAWGDGPDAHPRLRARTAAVLALLPRPLLCLGLTAAGQPRHPLRLRADTPLAGFPPAAATPAIR